MECCEFGISVRKRDRDLSDGTVEVRHVHSAAPDILVIQTKKVGDEDGYGGVAPKFYNPFIAGNVPSSFWFCCKPLMISF